MSVIERLQKAVAAFVNTFTEAATEDQATDPHPTSSDVHPQVLSREDVYQQPATDAPSHATGPERQEAPVRVETAPEARSEDREASPSPLQEADAVSLPPEEVTLLYSWSFQSMSGIFAPSRYGYQLTDDKRAAQSHNDRGTVSVAYIDQGSYVKTIDLKGESDQKLYDDILVAKRQGYDTLVARNASDGERIYDRYIVFSPRQIHLLSETSYEQDLEEVQPSLRGISATSPMQGTDSMRGVEFVMEDEGGELLVSARLDKEGRIIAARAADDSYERLEMFIGRQCDEVFGEGSWDFFRQNPGYPYERGDRTFLEEQKVRLIEQMSDESWNARLARPVRMAYPDRVHSCQWIDYFKEQDILALGERNPATAKMAWFPLFPESLPLGEMEILSQAHDFYFSLENLRRNLKETSVYDCWDEVTQYLIDAEYARTPDTVREIETILREYDVMGNDPDILHQATALRREVGLPSVDWQTFPNLDGDELDWLVTNHETLQQEGAPIQNLPASLAEKFPGLQQLAAEETRDEFLDLLGHVETMACCKWATEQGVIEYTETDTVWEGEKARQLWSRCVDESQAIRQDSQRQPDPDLEGFRGVSKQPDSFWHGYRYEQPRLQLYIDQEPFLAYAFAKGTMSPEQMTVWKDEIMTASAGLEFPGGITARVRMDVLYLKVEFEKEGHALGRCEIGASNLEFVMPLRAHLQQMAASLEQVWNNERHSTDEQDYPFYPSEEALRWDHIFPANYAVTLENEHQWKALIRYQEAKDIATEPKPMKFPAAFMIDSSVTLPAGQSPTLIDIGDFILGSYLQTTPRADLQELLSRFDGVYSTDLFEIHLDRPQRVFDETGVRYYHTLVGKEGTYRLISHRHDGNVPVPSYMNRQLLIDTLRTSEKQMCLRNKDVDAVLRWGVDVGEQHYEVHRMDDGLFYLTDQDRQPLGKGVELAAADERFEEAMKESLHTAVRYRETMDYSAVYERMQESHVTQLFLSDSIPVMQGGSIIGIRIEEDYEEKGNKDLVPMALIQRGSDEPLTYPVSLLSLRTRHALERTLDMDLSATLQGRKTMTGTTRIYKDAQATKEIPASRLSGVLLAEMSSRGLERYPFPRPFDIKDAGISYHFSGLQQIRLNGHPECAFLAQKDGVSLQLPSSHLPERITLHVVNESLSQLEQTESMGSVPRDITHPGKTIQIVPTPETSIRLVSDEMSYTADCMLAYGIESIRFDAPLRLGDITIHGVSIEEGLLEVDVESPKSAQHETMPMTELTESEAGVLMEQCLDAVYSGQTESYRDELTEQSLRDILQTGPGQMEVDIPEYGKATLYVQRDHVMLDIPETESREALVLPWASLERMDIKASLEEQVRQLPFDAGTARLLYEDQLGKLSIREGRFILEGQVQSYDITNACQDLIHAGVNLNQASRESLATFCHRHKATFPTAKGDVTAQLYRSYNEYELKIIQPQRQSHPSEIESVL